MDDFNEMVRVRRGTEEAGKAKYKAESKDRLSRILTKKITTTMIGALASIETNLGFLWDSDDPNKAHLEELYEKVRQEILDNGNNQIRNFKTELEQYNVEWLRYKLTLPVRKQEEKDG